MQVDAFGDGVDLAWVMGWGNRADSCHERWLVDELVDAGYRVHAIELPTTTPDFQRDCVAPVRAYLDDLEDYVPLAHSMGGLALCHVDLNPPAVYLSPWWGMHDPSIVVEPLLSLPIATPFLPFRIKPAELGELATSEDATAPARIAPKWVQTIRRAQRSLPALDPDAHVFYAPDDAVVDPAAIEAHAPESQRTTYDGGHELFSSRGRDEYVQWVLDALGDRA